MQKKPKPTEKGPETNPIEVYKYLRFTENAKSLAVEEEKKKNW